MTDRWTVEEWLEYQATGKMPEQPCELGVCRYCGKKLNAETATRCPDCTGKMPAKPRPCSATCTGHVSHPCEKCGQQWGQPSERVVKEVTTGRHHRKLVKRADVGVTFDSLTEERRWLYLREQPEVIWIDVHPIFELGSGIRYCADFLVHWVEHPDKPVGLIHHRVEDVKSKRSLTTAFKDRKKLFDAVHPFAPLTVVQWIDKQWKVTT